MKMIALRRRPDEAVAYFPEADIIPDSAITLPGKPLFLPDFAADWEATLLVGFRVSRLGKGMAARFAPRYYDAVTLMMRLCPLPAAAWPGALASAFDGCIQQGEWLPLPPERSQAVTLACGGLSLTIGPEALAVDAAVEAVGRYLTIRNGDIICPVTLPVSIPVRVGDIIDGSIGPAPCLRVRLK